MLNYEQYVLLPAKGKDEFNFRFKDALSLDSGLVWVSLALSLAQFAIYSLIGIIYIITTNPNYAQFTVNLKPEDFSNLLGVAGKLGLANLWVFFAAITLLFIHNGIILYKFEKFKQKYARYLEVKK